MSDRNRFNVLLVLPIVSFIWLAGTVIIAGLYYPEYSHSAQFISELGATGSPYGSYVNYLGFIPAELLIFAFVAFCYSAVPKTKQNRIGVALIGLYGTALSLAAIFPCDYQCRPVEPTLFHNIHMLLAVSAYMSVMVSMFILSSFDGYAKTFKIGTRTISVICILLFIALDPESKFVGVYQRLLEGFIYVWFIYFGYILRGYFHPKNFHHFSDNRKS
ncbi:DUF998 domain-containing protein [Parasalinivibrio latis]|uniref:DUF998 domain-containing protein n=1 Tax=Parasalinivibrio latis TaxID=2952610 RepID=UPI0030E06FB8